MNLADAQNLADADVRWFSKIEEGRIMGFPLPGDHKVKYGGGAVFYPRRPIESPAAWFKAHYAKLRSLLRAEGMQ